MKKEEEKIFNWAILIMGFILLLLVVTLIITQKNEQKENTILRIKNEELRKNFILCGESFLGCYNDLRKCVIEKNNITESQLDLMLNIYELIK